MQLRLQTNERFLLIIIFGSLETSNQDFQPLMVVDIPPDQSDSSSESEHESQDSGYAINQSNEAHRSSEPSEPLFDDSEHESQDSQQGMMEFTDQDYLIMGSVSHLMDLTELSVFDPRDYTTPLEIARPCAWNNLQGRIDQAYNDILVKHYTDLYHHKPKEQFKAWFTPAQPTGFHPVLMSIPHSVLEALNFAKTSQLPQGTYSLSDISQAGVLTPVPQVLPQSDCMEIQQQVCLVRNMNVLTYQQTIQGFVTQPMLINTAWYPHETSEAMHLKVYDKGVIAQTPPGHPLVVRVSCFLRINELQALEAIWQTDNSRFQTQQWRDYLSNHELSDKGYFAYLHKQWLACLTGDPAQVHDMCNSLLPHSRSLLPGICRAYA